MADEAPPVAPPSAPEINTEEQPKETATIVQKGSAYGSPPVPAATSLPIKSAAIPSGVAPLSEKKLSSVDPNKRTFQPYGNAAALFVQMGAYRGGPATFAVVGHASKPLHVFGRPWYKCEWVPNNGNASVRAKAYKMLPDWGYGRVYTVVVVNCTFAENPNADNIGGKLMVYAYYSESPRRYKKFTALEEAPGSYNESVYKLPYKYELLEKRWLMSTSPQSTLSHMSSWNGRSADDPRPTAARTASPHGRRLLRRDQNLQLHRRGHNLLWKLRQRSSKEVRKRVYVCPETTCVHHDPSRALRTPHSGFHFDGTARKFFKVSIPECRQSFVSCTL